MHTAHTYDILIAGGGLAGLTLAVELTRHPFFSEKKIAIIERAAKNTNDRTWCFWATDAESLPPCIHRSWHHAFFGGIDVALDFEMAPYQYYMVRSSAFYAWAKAQIKGKVTWICDTIQTFEQVSEDIVVVKGASTSYTGQWLFNSALQSKELYPKNKKLLPESYFGLHEQLNRSKNVALLQHFKGHFIKTASPVFKKERIHLMDFRIPQEGATRFFYVLPFSETEALVEFTLFSAELLESAAYDKAIATYLEEFWAISDYEVIEEEFGVIPMTNYTFPQQSAANIFNIGTAGGYVKASSGYAFLRTQRKIRALVADWVTEGKPSTAKKSAWKGMMDSVLLGVLAEGSLTGAAVFSALFKHCEPTFILRFLDEDTTFQEDLKIMLAVPSLPFTKAAIKHFLP